MDGVGFCAPTFELCTALTGILQEADGQMLQATGGSYLERYHGKP